ncbi:hypothetical protein FJT64_000341 [Amphibalanus amphitrite]|uniref:Uncharacterized protein n=1 Tax=Amphibalanus amphitrite TaxID=1232801 RepID=A0A6A4W3L8_AMPAM|nr:hypothetical protein FJT64_000341 [Amphibalanus amphitrite]
MVMSLFQINITASSFPRDVCDVTISDVEMITFEPDSIFSLTSLEDIKITNVSTLILLPRSLARGNEFERISARGALARPVVPLAGWWCPVPLLAGVEVALTDPTSVAGAKKLSLAPTLVDDAAAPTTAGRADCAEVFAVFFAILPVGAAFLAMTSPLVTSSGCWM